MKSVLDLAALGVLAVHFSRVALDRVSSAADINPTRNSELMYQGVGSAVVLSVLSCGSTSNLAGGAEN
jgi:hypothetical protein